MMSSNRIEKSGQLSTSIKLKFIISAIVLLILALGFNALLSLHSLEKLYVESIASQYSAVGKDLQRNLEKSLRFGKSLKKFFGIEKILEETKQNILKKISQESLVRKDLSDVASEDEISVSIILPDSRILYSTNETLVDTILPKEAHIRYDKGSSEKKPTYIKYNNFYITSLPIRDRNMEWLGSALIIFDAKRIDALLNAVRNQNVKEISLILVCSILLMLFLLPLIHADEPHVKHWKLRVSLIMFLVIILAQIAFSGLNIRAFKNYYLQINKQKTEMLTTLLKEDIEFLLSKGIKMNKLIKMDVLLGEIITASPELNDITILDEKQQPLYMATKDGIIDFQNATDEQLQQAQTVLAGETEVEYNVFLDITKGDDVEGYISANVSKEGYISTNISKEVVFATLLEISLDSATVIVISLLFFGELLILIFVYIERQIFTRPQEQKGAYGAIRPAAFLFLFGAHISISFLPLHMEALYEPLWGFSKDIVIGLPISTEMFFTGISMVIAGIWIDRRGWHQAFFTGLFLTGIGTIYSWFATDALQFILSRGLVGLGYGFALMSSQGFVISYTSENNKAHGLAHLFAGVYAGSICGSAAGAMLADRIGFRSVFLLGAIIIFLVIAYTILFMRYAFRKREDSVSGQREHRMTFGQVFRFFFNRNVLSLNILSALPAALAIVGFLNYFSPIYLNRIGASQSNIGRIFMIYGVCLVYVAPFISKYIDASKNQKMYIVVSGILGSMAFLLFYFSGGITATAIAVLFLGLSSSFAASQRSYILGLETTKRLGAGKAMGVFNSVYRVGQVLGPMTFGWLLAFVSIKHGITYLGLCYLFATGLFLLAAKNPRKIQYE